MQLLEKKPRLQRSFGQNLKEYLKAKKSKIKYMVLFYIKQIKAFYAKHLLLFIFWREKNYFLLAGIFFFCSKEIKINMSKNTSYFSFCFCFYFFAFFFYLQVYFSFLQIRAKSKKRVINKKIKIYS